MPPNSASSKRIVNHYFAVLSDDTRKCVCGKVIKQTKNKGYTNLLNHVKSAHPNYQKEVYPSENQIDAFAGFVFVTKVTKKAENYYAWLDCVCSELKPFSFVDSQCTKKYTKLTLICRNTLMKW